MVNNTQSDDTFPMHLFYKSGPDERGMYTYRSKKRLSDKDFEDTGKFGKWTFLSLGNWVLKSDKDYETL